MSISTKITTFEHMLNATVHGVSSSSSGFPVGNLLVPMPNCYWKSNQADYHHQITLKFETMSMSNMMVLVTAEEENSETLAGIDADIEYANAADGTWTSVSNLVEPGITEGTQIKLFRYDTTILARYWRITLNGYDSPDQYPPEYTKLYSAWIGREWTLGAHAWPAVDTPEYRLIEAKLPYGIKHATPVKYAPSIEFDREYLLTGDDIAQFNCIMKFYAGLPIVVQEGDDPPFMALVVGDFMETEITNDIKIGKIRFKTIPVLGWDKVY